VPSGTYAPDWTVDPTGPCADPSHPDASCWDTLNMAGFVDWWWGEYEHLCAGAGFGDCFYDKQTPYSPALCSQLNSNPACTQPKWDDFKNKTWNAARTFYTAWNIWNMNGFYHDYYTTIGDSSSIASDSIGKIAGIIDPVKASILIRILLNFVLTLLINILPGISNLISHH
jgi:hypothetical protein